MENWRKLSQNYHQLLLNKFSDLFRNVLFIISWKRKKYLDTLLICSCCAWFSRIKMCCGKKKKKKKKKKLEKKTKNILLAIPCPKCKTYFLFFFYFFFHLNVSRIIWIKFLFWDRDFSFAKPLYKWSGNETIQLARWPRWLSQMRVRLVIRRSSDILA